jgi:hypothetical protein
MDEELADRLMTAITRAAIPILCAASTHPAH